MSIITIGLGLFIGILLFIFQWLVIWYCSREKQNPFPTLYKLERHIPLSCMLGACERGDLDTIKRIVESGVFDKAEIDSILSAGLTVTAFYERLDISVYLIEKGAGYTYLFKRPRSILYYLNKIYMPDSILIIQVFQVLISLIALLISIYWFFMMS